MPEMTVDYEKEIKAFEDAVIAQEADRNDDEDPGYNSGFIDGAKWLRKFAITKLSERDAEVAKLREERICPENKCTHFLYRKNHNTEIECENVLCPRNNIDQFKPREISDCPMHPLPDEGKDKKEEIK